MEGEKSITYSSHLLYNIVPIFNSSYSKSQILSLTHLALKWFLVKKSENPSPSLFTELDEQDDEARGNEPVHEYDQFNSTNEPDKGHKNKGPTKPPLLEEVTIIEGSRGWICKHCQKKFTSSYTRIHAHFFGPEPGKKSDIQRCKVLMDDRHEYQRIRKKVQDAEKQRVSTRLKQSTIIKKHTLKPMSQTPIGLSFANWDRDAVDMKIMRCLCANAIPFNVLRSPYWGEMVHAINNGPKGYKSPSSEKARTTLLDECLRGVMKDMDPVRDTWYTHGVSIVSDGWSNCKQDQLINIIATNSRGAMYIKSDVFNGIEKTGKVIAEYLLQAIKEIGPSNVLQVVTDNAKNCVVAGN